MSKAKRLRVPPIVKRANVLGWGFLALVRLVREVTREGDAQTQVIGMIRDAYVIADKNRKD